MVEFKETACTNCVHSNICIHEDDFLETKKKIDNILKTSRFFCELRCPYYFENHTSIRKRGVENE